MLIPVLAASIVGISFIKLGAMSVQISVLSLTLQAAMSSIALGASLLVALFGLLLWQGRAEAA